MSLTWVLIVSQILVASSSSCFKKGLCIGQQIKIKDSVNEFECLKKCKDISNCFWASFHQSDQKCILSASCSSVADLDQYTYSQKSCERLVMNIGGTLTASNNAAEVIDLYDSDFQCPVGLDSCLHLIGGLGGFVNGIPTVCGGICETSSYKESTKTCFQLQNGSFRPVQVPFLAVAESFPAFVQVEDGLLYANNDLLRKVSDDNSVTNLSQMPFNLHDYCMVRLDDGTLVIFNGVSGGLASTTFYNPNPQYDEWTAGPISSPPRHSLACGILNQKSNGRTYIVTAGGIGEVGNLNVSKCLDVTEGINSSLEMFDCPPLPEALSGSKIISDRENGQIFLIGGAGDYAISKRIYMLEDVVKDWQSIGNLKDRRYHQVSFFLDDYEMNC